CSAPLGMESRHIKDSQITASSQWDGNHAAIQGRLNFKAGGGKTGGWSARSNNGNQWIQVALGSYTKLTSIATQGRNAHNQWVTAYKLQYSDDGMNFYYYKVPGHSSPKTFEGNKDRDSVVYHNLNPPIQARYIRLRPTAWYRHISLRMELYGCRGSQS
ncbi:lactadherin-like, partial [Stylophora pistillata]|uniref:lactadherin-like n=1 Tax=Stylophora pistillata TaxID=50429 RepID=UPI000C0516BC